MKKPTKSRYVQRFKIPNDKMLEYIYKTKSNVYNFAEGSIRSAKTTSNILAFAMALEESDDILHLAIGVTASSARTIIFEGDGLGLKYYPEWSERTELINGKLVRFQQRVFTGKYEGNDCIILLPKPGSDKPIKYVVAMGGGLSNSYESFHGWSVGMVIATEYDLLHPNTWQAIQSRTANSSLRRIFADFNPTDEQHMVYKKLEELKGSLGGFNYVHATLVDNPAMTPQRIKEIMSEYDPDSLDYKRYILGQRINPAGLIYNVRDYNIIDEWDKNEYIRYIVVADPGENSSATAFILMGLRKFNKGVDVLKEYYHRNADERGAGIKLPYDYAVDFINFCKECEELIGKPLYNRLSDHDLTFIREYDRIKYKMNYGYALNKVIKDEIDERIKTGINLLYKGRLRFHKDCINTIQSFKSAVYDSKKEKLGKYERLDDPQNGTRIDHIDAVEYGFTEFKNELQRYTGDVV